MSESMATDGGEQAGLAGEARRLLPWAYAAFWVGAVGVGVELLAAIVGGLGLLSGPNGVGAFLTQVGLTLVELAVTAALLSGVWAACVYLRGLTQGAPWGPATLTVLRAVGDACVGAAVLAMLVAPTLTVWITQTGGFDLRLESAFLALLGLGALLGLIARVFAQTLAQAAAAQAELDQIV